MEGESGARSRAGLRRREFLIGGAGAGIALAGPLNYAAMARSLRVPAATHGKFAHGVAAGFPSPKGDHALDARLRAAPLVQADPRGRQGQALPRRRRRARRSSPRKTATSPSTQHVGGLKAGHEYFYRFETKHKSSRVGRFRTLPPPDSKQKLRIGFYSCQDYEAGYFNTQAALAKEDLDLVVCLGDYIYEHSYYDGPRRPRRHDRRQRRRRRPDARRVPREVPLLPGRQGPAGDARRPRVRLRLGRPRGRGQLRRRRARLRRRPTRTSRTTTATRAGCRSASGARTATRPSSRRCRASSRRATTNQIYGSIRIGGLAELFLTDQRQYRDPQPCDDALLEPCPTTTTPAAPSSARTRRPGSRRPCRSRTRRGSSGAARSW